MNINWDFIIDNILADKTILCLGSELFSNGQETLDKRLKSIIGDTPDVRMYDDGLFHFKNTGDMTSYTKIKRFYNQGLPEVNATLDKLAQIRFSTIVSLNPDVQLVQSFVDNTFPHQYAYHHPNNTAKELALPSCDEPLIYNLLGNIHARESMILTHEDLFEFLESVVERKSIPQSLKVKVKSAYNFIFIGLPFGKWHTQLLVRVLQKDMNRKALKFAANHAKDEGIEMFCQDEFNIVCVPTNITDFVNELYKRCESADLLRAAAAATNLYDIWMKKVKKDELAAVLELATDYFEKEQPNDDNNISHLVHLSGRLSNLERKVSRNTISHENALVERSQIRDAIIQFLTDVVRLL